MLQGKSFQTSCPHTTRKKEKFKRSLRRLAGRADKKKLYQKEGDTPRSKEKGKRKGGMVFSGLKLISHRRAGREPVRSARLNK